METVLRRSFRPGHAPIPDLIIVDGGSGQQAAALRTLNAFAVPVPTLGISERPVLNAGTRNLALGKDARWIFRPEIQCRSSCSAGALRLMTRQ
jgi:excinuclease UvrABC nuclease subunit